MSGASHITLLLDTKMAGTEISLKKQVKLPLFGKLTPNRDTIVPFPPAAGPKEVTVGTGTQLPETRARPSIHRLHRAPVRLVGQRQVPVTALQVPAAQGGHWRWQREPK